jgi:O-6-methylguanine DNA methyltransferase
MTPFQTTVHKLVQKIPKGKVATYGSIAKKAGRPGAARAVGMTMKCNPSNKITPCHRVVSSSGALTGYTFGGISAKRKLLDKERVVFKGDRVDLSKSLWK